MTVFRVLIPTWRFFEELAPLPTMEVRRGEAPWQEVRLTPVEPLRWRHLFLNPAGNRALAARALLERLAAEPEDPISRALVRRLAGEHLPAGPGAGELRLMSDGQELLRLGPLP